MNHPEIINICYISSKKKKLNNLMSFSPLVIFSLFIFFSCNSAPEKDDINLKLSANYPRWLKSGSYHTDQTSGITFTGKSEKGEKTFFLADDIGKIHRLIISNDTIFQFFPLHFDKKIIDSLAGFPKADFEEITYDEFTNSVFLSIEGNYPDPKKFTGIYSLNFKDNNINSDSIVSFERLDIQPKEEFEKYLKNNIAYEGLAVDKNYLYLGLEGFKDQNIFVDSTVIFIVDKNDLKIKKEIPTKSLGIFTICGLYSDADYSLFGVDRNNKKLFRIVFDKDLNINTFKVVDIDTHVPGFSLFQYVSSIESITLDDDKNIYLVDDPWKQFFIPADEVLKELDSATNKNFKDFIPIIYKFRNRKE